MGNNDAMPDIKTILAILASIGGGILALAKWWDSHRSERAKQEDQRKKDKVAREDWLIENAFDIVKGLREELDRLRALNIQLGADLDIAYTRIRHLEAALRSHGVDVPSM